MRILKVLIPLCILISLILGFAGTYTVLAQQNDYAQGIETLLYLRRGLVWDSWTGKNHGLSANYAWPDGKYSFPGFEPGLIKANIGSWAVHMEASTWSMGALRYPNLYPGNVPVREQIQNTVFHWEGVFQKKDFTDSTADYVQLVSNFRWKNGENYYLRRNPLEAEEVIDAAFQFNPNYRWDPKITPVDRHFLPIKAQFAIREWTGSRQDQYYQLEELKITNISNDPKFNGYTGDDITLYDFYLAHNYFTNNNRRSWLLMGYQSGTGGEAAQGWSVDDHWIWDADRKMMVVIDGDYKRTPEDDTFDFMKGRGTKGQGEYGAPGHIGLGIMYTTPDKLGRSPSFHNFWNAYYYQTGMESVYRGTDEWLILTEGFRTTYALTDNDSRYGTVLFDCHVVAGPWDIAPGESITVVQFQGIGSVDLEIASNINRMATIPEIATGLDSIKMLWDRASITTKMALQDGYATGGAKYKGWNMPDPPGCPFDFTISPDFTETGNLISWSDWADKQPDADYIGTGEEFDLQSYTVWRSDYLPFMGWKAIANIPKKDAKYYNSATSTYLFSDRDVKIGFSYYYALSSSDAGHNTWPPRPEALKEYPRVFPNGKVPPLQSNLQASLNYALNKSKWTPFRTRRAPGKSLSEVKVFPNPFIMRAGFVNPGEEDGIHFVNIPADCEIRIFSMRGDLVAKGPGTIQMRQEQGSGEAVWKQVTLSEQYVESGMYYYVIEAKSGTDKGKTFRGKLAIIR